MWARFEHAGLTLWEPSSNQRHHDFRPVTKWTTAYQTNLHAVVTSPRWPTCTIMETPEPHLIPTRPVRCWFLFYNGSIVLVWQVVILSWRICAKSLTRVSLSLHPDLQLTRVTTYKWTFKNHYGQVATALRLLRPAATESYVFFFFRRRSPCEMISHVITPRRHHHGRKFMQNTSKLPLQEEPLVQVTRAARDAKNII